MQDNTQLVQKTTVRFAKIGPSIYHSHHDMIRFWERAVKRAELPLRLTQGFNPRPRIIFPHALGVGIASRHEEVELELSARLAVAEIVEKLRKACGDTLEIVEARNLPPVKKSRQVTATSYLVLGWSETAAGMLPEAVEKILAMPEIVVERGAPGDRRRADVRPYLTALVPSPDVRGLEIELRHTPTGSARPDEIVKLAASLTDEDWRDLSIEKTGMTLE